MLYKSLLFSYAKDCIQKNIWNYFNLSLSIFEITFILILL